MAVSFQLTRDDVSPRLTQAASRAKNPLPVFRAMGTTFKSITEGTFNSVGASYRPASWKPKSDGSPSILQKSTTMAKSFLLEVTSSYAKLSNPAIYAPVHQFGAVIRAKNKKALKFRVGEAWFSKKAVTIPARPFYPVLGGRLIPAAEEKIARAGERALARETGAA